MDDRTTPSPITPPRYPYRVLWRAMATDDWTIDEDIPSRHSADRLAKLYQLQGCQTKIEQWRYDLGRWV